MTKSELHFNEILETMAEEGLSMRKACLKFGVRASNFLKYVEESGKKEQYTRAREAACDVLADKLLEVAEETVLPAQNGGIDAASVSYAKLKVDTIKWQLSKQSRRYAEKSIIDHASSDGSVRGAIALTNEQLAEELKKRNLPTGFLEE
jgi:hypothetical protein